MGGGYNALLAIFLGLILTGVVTALIGPPKESRLRWDAENCFRAEDSNGALPCHGEVLSRALSIRQSWCLDYGDGRCAYSAHGAIAND